MRHFIVFFIVGIIVSYNVSSSKTNGTDAETYFNRGIERYDNATQLHTNLDNIHPTDSENATELKKQVRSQYKEAIAHFDKTIELNPNYAKAYYYRGLATYRIGEYSHKYDYEYDYQTLYSALPYFDKAIELSPTIEYLAEAYYMRGLAKTKHLEREEAIKDFDKAILHKPDFADAYFHRGINRYKQDRIAIVDFEKAIQFKTSFVERAYTNMGIAKIRLGRYRSAIKDYNKAIELDPHPESYLWRARAKLELGEHDAAMADYDEAVEISFKMINTPKGLNYRRCLLTRIVAKFEMGQYLSAIEDCDKHIQVYSNPTFNLDAYYLRGNARVYLHQYEAAMEDYEKYLQIALSKDESMRSLDIDASYIKGRHARDFYKLGLVKWKLGLYEQARADFEEALQRTQYEKKDLLEIENYENPFLKKIRGSRWNLRDGSNSFSYEIYGETRAVNIDEELKEYTIVKF